MVGDRRLALANRFDEVTHADLTPRRCSQDAQHPQPDRVGQGGEAVGQLGCLRGIEGRGQHRRAALVEWLDRDVRFVMALPLTGFDVSIILDASTPCQC